MYNKELNRELNKTKKSDLNVNIIYVDNNQSYFTYNSLLWMTIGISLMTQ